MIHNRLFAQDILLILKGCMSKELVRATTSWQTSTFRNFRRRHVSTSKIQISSFREYDLTFDNQCTICMSVRPNGNHVAVMSSGEPLDATNLSKCQQQKRI